MACTFRCPDKVLSVAMSGCAASHALIAVGSKKSELVLADIVSGAFTHTLDGHTWVCRLHCWHELCGVLALSGAELHCAGHTLTAES